MQNPSNFDKILALLQSSAVTQGVLSIIVLGGYVYMIIAQISIPPSFDAIAGLVVGFFFGGKVQAAIGKTKGS
jgi:hypothetical protein